MKTNDPEPWQTVEYLVEKVIQGYGFATIPRRKYNQNMGNEIAPMLESKNVKTVLPDITATGGGKTWEIEVKSKNQYVEYRKKDFEPQHGIDRPNWHDYITIKEETGHDVYLFIFEQDSGKLIRQNIESLVVDHEHSSGGSGGEPMVYFDRSLFDEVPIPRSIHNKITEMVPKDGSFDYQVTLSPREDAEKFDLFKEGRVKDNNQSGLGKFV